MRTALLAAGVLLVPVLLSSVPVAQANFCIFGDYCLPYKFGPCTYGGGPLFYDTECDTIMPEGPCILYAQNEVTVLGNGPYGINQCLLS